MKHLIAAFGIIASMSAPATPKVMVVFRLASPPLPVEAGQEFALCAANVGTTSADLTLQFVSVRTSAIVASKDVMLPPPGTGVAMPNPCLTVSAEDVAAAGRPAPGEPAMVVGVVVTKRGLFARPVTATAAVQVTGAGPNGTRRLLTSVPLHMATMTNGRNTPIETVH